MKTQTSFKRLIVRAVLRKVSAMVIRILALPDYLDLSGFDEVFRTLLGWEGLGFNFHIHGQEFTSFLRMTRTRWKMLRDFQLRPRETFLCTCGGIDLWEWEFRLLDSDAGSNGDEVPVCLAGRGASPPEHCGGPTGYRLMQKRQKDGESMGEPAQAEAVIALLPAAHPNQPASTWDILREAMDDGVRSIDQQFGKVRALGSESLQLKRSQPTVGEADGAWDVPRIRFRVEVICVNDEGAEQRHDMMEMERQDLAMETLGLSLTEGKAILRGVQDFVVSQQISEDLKHLSSHVRM